MIPVSSTHQEVRRQLEEQSLRDQEQLETLRHRTNEVFNKRDLDRRDLELRVKEEDGRNAHKVEDLLARKRVEAGIKNEQSETELRKEREVADLALRKREADLANLRIQHKTTLRSGEEAIPDPPHVSSSFGQEFGRNFGNVAPVAAAQPAKPGEKPVVASPHQSSSFGQGFGKDFGKGSEL